MANEKQIDNLIELIDGYVEKGGHHLNVNVFTRETLLDETGGAPAAEFIKITRQKHLGYITGRSHFFRKHPTDIIC